MAVGLPLLSPAAPALQVEDELLLLCARTHMTPDQEARVHVLAADVGDWAALVEIATWHGVLPLLTKNVLAICPDLVPVPICKMLLARRAGTARANRVLALELVRLLGTFKQHGIDVVSLKGPMLTANVYGNISLREFGDLDILVRPRDRKQAHHILLGQGYRSMAPHNSSAVFLQHLLRAHYHYAFQHTRMATVVELHWQMNPRFVSLPLNSPGLWRRLEQRRLLTTTVPDLSAEDTLLQLCLHGSKHVWNRMKYVCDVAACVARYPNMNWLLLIARSKGLRSERMLFVGLDLAHRLLDIPLAKPAAEAIDADLIVTALSTRLVARLMSRQDFGYRFEAFEMAPYWLKFKSHRRDQFLVYLILVLFMGLALTPSAKDRALVSLPGWLAPLYYLVRPVRVMGLGTLLIMQVVIRRIGTILSARTHLFP